jgi:Ca-activated chloride channel family protein
MAVASRNRRVSLAVLAAVATAAPPAAPLLAAAPDARAVSPDACARLGYEVGRDNDRYGTTRSRAHAPSVGGYAARPPALAAAPQPSRTLDVTVTAQRRESPPVEKRIEEPKPGRMIPPPPPPPPPGIAFPGPPAGAVETERYPHAADNPVRRTAEDPVSTFSIDVDTAAYANVRRFLNDGARPPRDAVRVEEMINYFDYGYPRPRDRAQPFSTYVSVAPSPWSRDRRILQIGLQGYELPRAQQPPLNLVFLIDTSGSMSSEDRLPLAKKALNLLIDQLGPRDRVSMVAYAGSAGAVLSPTGGQDKLKMRCALEALGAGGSTAGGAGLALAYALARQNFDPHAVNRVILMTDGDFNVGVADPAKLKDFVAEKRRTGVYLSVYGFGRGNYNDAMMQTLAQNGNGTAGYIDTLAEGRKTFRKDFAGSLFPIADDVKVQVEFNPAAVSEYRLIGYETRLLNREDLNNDRVDAGEVGSGASVTALYEITPAGARASSDPLRYGTGRPRPPQAGGGELAFLKIRYKLPGQPDSRLMTRPITDADAYDSVAAAPEPTRWATAVAGFGQRLRGDPWLDERFGWSEIADLAQGARGEDAYGLRAEFVQLVRAAGDARSVSE